MWSIYEIASCLDREEIPSIPRISDDECWYEDFEEFIKGYEKEVLDMVNILSDKEDLLYSVTEAYSEGYDSEQLEVRLYASPDKRLEAAEKKIREYSEDLYRVLYDLVVP
tara:strand:+ start:4978 stop:5307 length:330 start_codon:yes stop_codon:yes gene_type:complete